MIVGLAILAGLPLPLLPLQILFLNLVTDVFPAFALAMGEGERGVLQRPPRDPKEPLLDRAQWLAIVLHGVALTVATFGALALSQLWLRLDEQATVTVTFMTIAFAQLWHVFNMRHPTSGLLHNEITQNPWMWAALALCAVILVTVAYVPALSHMLHLAAPDIKMWGVVISMSLAPLLIGLIVRSFTGSHETQKASALDV
jgi:Ca2+-transporting ATPase